MTITAAKLQVQVDADTTKATSNLQKFGSTLGSIGKQAAGVAIGVTIAKGAEVGVSALLNLGKTALGAYADLERLQASLQSMVARQNRAFEDGSLMSMAEAMQNAQGEAQALVGWIEKLAIQSPFTSQDIASSLRMSMAYGFTTQQAQRLTAAMLDFTAGSGASSESMNRIALALGHMPRMAQLPDPSTKKAAYHTRYSM
jgi:hypothetical protein